MNQDKRFVLAFTLSLIILLFYPTYLRWISPARPPAGEKTDFQSKQHVGEALKNAPPHLPAKPELTIPEHARKENFYQFSNSRFDAEFSDLGGVITKLFVKNWSPYTNGAERLIERESAASSAFLATLANQGVDFSREFFFLETLNEKTGEVRLAAEVPDRWRLQKEFFFDPARGRIEFRVSAKNLGNKTEATAFEVTSNLNAASKRSQDGLEAKTFTSLRDKLASTNLGKLVKKPEVIEGEILWQALDKKHFAIIFRPDRPASFLKAYVTQGDTHVMRSVMRFPIEEVKPGETLERTFLVYAGPQYYDALKSFESGFERMLSSGVLGFFKYWLLIALRTTRQFVGNYGWAIIILTCFVKLLLSPFTHMSFESMRKMQALQPKIKALQDHCKNDQAKLSKETMELYKRHKVNPMGGCLPMLLQIPIFIAFYQVLVQTVELRGAPFIFWIRDLSEPDRLLTLPFSIPFLGSGLNVLPILMLGSMVWQQQLTPQTGSREQQQMMMIMPIVFGVIFYSLPSGLVLYWLVNNILSILHQLFIKGKALPHHEE